MAHQTHQILLAYYYPPAIGGAREVLDRAFLRANYDTYEAKSGNDALRILGERAQAGQSIDLALVSVDLLGKDGLEVLVDGTRASPNTKFILYHSEDPASNNWRFRLLKEKVEQYGALLLSVLSPMETSVDAIRTFFLLNGSQPRLNQD